MFISTIKKANILLICPTNAIIHLGQLNIIVFQMLKNGSKFIFYFHLVVLTNITFYN